jgi:DNA repair ATPase RecN
MTSEHFKYLREVLEHDAIGFGEYDQLPAAIEHFEALEHASGQYRKAMSEQAKRIEQLEAALRKLDDMVCELDAGNLQLFEVGDFIDAALAGEKKDG